MKRLGAIVLAILAMLFYYSGNNKRSNVIELSDIYNAKQDEIDRNRSLVVIEEKDRLESDYLNGVYPGDYEEVKHRLNEEAAVYFRNNYGTELGDDDYLLTDLDLTHSVYLKAKEENLSFEFIINNHSESINEIVFYLTCFQNINYNSPHADNKSIVYDKGVVFEKVSVDYPNVNIFITTKLYDSRFVSDYMQLREEITEIYEITTKLNIVAKDTIYYSWSGINLDVYNHSDYAYNDYTQLLEKKYDTEFIFVYSDKKRAYYAPILNPHYVFQSNNVQDEFSNTYAQHFVSEKANDAITKNEASDFIGQFTYCNKGKDNAVDMTVIHEAPLKIVESTGIETSLYYLKSIDEEADFDLIVNIINDLAESLGYSEKLEIYVFIYNVDAENIYPITQTFMENIGSENYIRDRSLSNMASNLHIYRNDRDSFKLLDSYGERTEYFYFCSPMNGIDKSGLEFKEFYVMDYDRL